MADDAQIGQVLLLDREQQASHSRPVNLDPEVVAFGMRRREHLQVIPIAEADFHDACSAPAKERIQIQGLCGEVNAESWPQLNERALLRRRHAPGTSDE